MRVGVETVRHPVMHWCMSSCCCSRPPEAVRPRSSRTRDLIRMTVAAFVAAQSMIFGLAVSMNPPVGATRTAIHLALMLSSIVVFALVGGPLVREAWNAARQRRIALEQFFLVGIAGAFAASVHCTLSGEGNVYYEVVAILLAIYTLGKLVLARQRQGVTDAAASLEAEFDRCEVLRPHGSCGIVPVNKVAIGDRIFVRAGDAICVDGVVREGAALVRQTALTGEVFPSVKRAGDPVWAGSFSLDGALVVEALVNGQRRRLDGLLESVRKARNCPAQTQQMVDRLTAWFLPIVLGASLLTFAYWTFRVSWSQGVINALAVLVVACPCSLGLATPIGVWTALSRLARRGIVPRDSAVVEKLARVDTVVFDKTGTLSEDEFQLVDFVVAQDVDREGLRRAVAAVETASSHPMARAFQQTAPGTPATEVRLIAGAGISGCVDGAQLVIGNASVLDEESRHEAEVLAAELRGADAVGHRVYILVDGQLAGIGLLREWLRDSARGAVHALQQMNIRSLVLTGDPSESEVLRDLGVPAETNLTPEQKAARVRELKRESRGILFVGDGVNDAPAMLEAGLAASIRNGSPLARESSSLELSNGDLGAIAFAIQESRHAMRTIRGNLLFAAAYNVTGILLAATGLIHPVLAALLMLASSFTVTLRATRGARQTDDLPKPTQSAAVFPQPTRNDGTPAPAFAES
jgi:heavy metal translocating P-type ATPase